MESSSEERLSKLFVGGLNRDTTKDGLQKYFEKFGEVKDCTVIMDNNTRESRGFGYVTFKDHKSTNEILDMKANDNPHIIDGKECEVKRAIPKDSANELAQQSTNKIFIGGLPEDAKQDDIKELIYSNIGKEPKSIVLLMRKEDETKNRGFCFVDLPTEDDADTLFCLKMIDMNGKKVEIKKADPRGRGGDRGRGRGQGGRGYSRGGQQTNEYYSGYPGSYMGTGYGAYGTGYGYGYGVGGYNGYASYRGTPAYSYENAYSSYSPSYGAYDGAYGGMGLYSPAASSYGPMKTYGTNSGAGYGNGASYGGSAGYRPY